jgi:hypothetical protein
MNPKFKALAFGRISDLFWILVKQVLVAIAAAGSDGR